MPPIVVTALLPNPGRLFSVHEAIRELGRLDVPFQRLTSALGPGMLLPF